MTRERERGRWAESGDGAVGGRGGGKETVGEGVEKRGKGGPEG